MKSLLVYARRHRYLLVGREIDMNVITVRIPDVDLHDVKIGDIDSPKPLTVLFEPGFERTPSAGRKREVFEPKFGL